MTDFKSRIYKSYRTTTSQNQYRPSHQKAGGEISFIFEHRWGRFLPTDRKSSILDLACGSGEFLTFLRQRGYKQLHGIDLSPEQVQAAHAIGLANVQEADAFTFLKQAKEQYAVISAFSFLEHLTRDELFELLDTVVNALQPGGLFLGLVPNAKGPFGAFVRYADITHEESFTPESIIQIASAIGLAPVYIGECGPIPHGPVSSLRWLVWQFMRAGYFVMRVSQAADYQYRIYTQDLRFVLYKPE
jgi:SAM-dependent methyltransferase